MIKRRFPDDRLLYVTQSERLVKQAYRDICGFLPGWDITQYGGSCKDNTGKDLVIATAAMLWTNVDTLKHTNWFRNFIAVMVDEAHHVVSPTLSKLLLRMPCYFRFGASDTKHADDPAKADKMRGLLGPIRYTVPVGVYIDLGRSAKPTIYLVQNDAWCNRFAHIPHQAEPDTPAWALVGNEWRQGTYLGPVYERDEENRVIMRKVRELQGAEEQEVHDGEGGVQRVKTAVWTEVERPVTLDGYHQIQFEGSKEKFDVDSRYCLLRRAIDKAVITFKERNTLIGQWVEYYTAKGWPTLVVCTRTMHVLILETLLGDLLGREQVKILFSDHTSKQRDEAFAWFRRTKGGVLVSPLVKEGVSISEIRAGVVADHVSGWEPMMQILGRFIRKKKSQNEAFITAFIDVQHPVLRRGGKNVWAKLFDTRGFTFCYPCLGPDSIARTHEYRTLEGGSPEAHL